MGKTKSRSGDGFHERAALLLYMQNLNRLRVFTALREGETKVTDLAATLEMSQSTVSQQLIKFRRAKLVTTRRDGNNIYYSCSSSEVVAVLDLLADLFETR
ncbi:ArsR/SmtB family transcription factor [Rhizobium sp. HT1-10]|uniref:ArsR/SmtB family transcription factor n=1 Tax=Rhizobium sp. HT1-10 TaxID=3111638 RepID=UPI003C306D39